MEPAVGRGVQLPEFPDLAALPAPDRSWRAVIGFGVGQVVLDSPAADLGAVGFKLALAEQFAGGKAVGGWGIAAEPFAQQRVHFRGPSGGMIAAGNIGRPGGLLMMGA